MDIKSVKKLNKEDLKSLQKDLKSKGLYTGRIDGIYGPLTERAVKNSKPNPTKDSVYKLTTTDDISGRPARTSKAELQDQLDATGTNQERRQGQILPDFLNDRLYNNLLPFAYESESYSGPVSRVVDNMIMNNPDPKVPYIKAPDGSIEKSWKDRYDAWALYLGRPQKDKSFKLSDYTPTKGDPNSPYYDFNNMSNKVRTRMLQDYINNQKDGKYIGADGSVSGDDMGTMGNYTLSGGKDDKGDYVSYYDKWDLNGSHGVGKPFDIYGRIYYDPKTKKIIPTKKEGGTISEKGYKKDSLYKNNKSLDINSGNITMHNVEFPILGISHDTGEKKIMMPNQNYNFMNTKKVKEIPLKNDADFLAAHLSTMSEDEQDAFVDHYQSIPDDQRNEIMQSLKKGGFVKLKKGGFISSNKHPEINLDNLTEGTFFVPDNKKEMLKILKEKGYDYQEL